ncbi:patatin-like phospholipase RssA [Pollutimonas bauzanensis]|uniref:NTE family protein n=1 Tax=Pollutimonas bauzanensis TaxID=658167 RepID=A0A1M5YRG9_9BURK|nr:patatin-like phospholipase RssA [Pollutimonas bauzanensis]SHI14173.1 NTE family protein [Pollutimonas bauzanensis]
MNPPRRKPRIGLVLGSGSARGWAHIGVIQALEHAGIRPDIVCGTSIGALVAAAYSVGELERFEKWVLGLGIKDVISFMDLRLNGGMLKGERLMEFFRRNFIDYPVEDLKIPFGAVATALHTGNEIWLRSGSTVDVVRASIALPGLFSPVWHDGQLLVDGGLVNPVPVSLARAMGAELVIAVDLNSDILGRHLNRNVQPGATGGATGSMGREWMQKLQQNISAFLPEQLPSDQRLPSMLDVVAASLNIMQVRLTRSRMAGEPPDIVISPRLAHLGLLDFHRAKVAIDEGRRAAEGCIPSLVELGLAPSPGAGAPPGLTPPSMNS